MKILHLSLIGVLPAVLLARPARADFLDGRCVNTQGQGVAAVNLDAKDTGGNDVPLMNDGTDANGFFHVTFPIGGGTYQIVFKPPQPPASTDLLTEIGPVTVSGTTNVGNVQLRPGVSLTGTVVDPGGAGVQGVNFDVIVLATGENVELIHDSTDASGAFSFASPSGSVEVHLDPPAGGGQTLAPKALELDLTGNTNLGTIQLAQGFVVAAIVRDPGNSPVAVVDLDVEVSSTGQDLYTPGDNTNSSGFVDVVVPAGTYDFEFCAPPSQLLATKLIPNVSISANTSLGTVILQNGFALSGHVQSWQGVALQGARVVVKDASTGVDVPVCHNTTVAGGDYSTVVPPGTFTVCALPPSGTALGAACASSVTVNGSTVVNLTLPAAFTPFCFGDGSLATACPCLNTGSSGRGCRNSQAGNTGALLVASGTTNPDAAVLTASSTPPTALSIFLQGNSPIAAGSTFGDGVRCAGGSLKRLFARNASGGVVTYPQGADPKIRARSAALGDVIPIGGTRYYQTYYRDASATFCPNPPGGTFNVTNGVTFVW